jgi:hypothetical protein
MKGAQLLEEAVQVTLFSGKMFLRLRVSLDFELNFYDEFASFIDAQPASTDLNSPLHPHKEALHGSRRQTSKLLQFFTPLQAF